MPTAGVAVPVFEILFIIGVLAWMMELLFEYLFPLPVFPTLLTALLSIPLLTWLDYQVALPGNFLDGVGHDRAPVPPEFFQWNLVRPRWRRQIILCAILMPVGWIPIFWFSARLDLSLSSLTGWFCGLLAIGSTSMLLSRLSLYFRVAQWFDEMTPRIAGWFWNLMYRISDNPEFLPEKSIPEKEKSVF